MEQQKERVRTIITNFKTSHPNLIQISETALPAPAIAKPATITPNTSTVLTGSTAISQNDVNNYTFPVFVNGGTAENPTIITFTENLVFNNTDCYFVVSGAYVVFDGLGNDVSLQIPGVNVYNGLILNGTGIDGVSNNDAFDFVTVTNINVVVDYTISSFLTQNFIYGQESGWICQPYYAVGTSNCVVSFCSSNGWIIGGGILGCYSTCNVNNCFTIGPIGLPIIQLILNNINDNVVVAPNITIPNDINYSLGFAGGICGHDCSNMTITNCFTAGRVRILSGGICGSFCNLSIVNCYCLGNVEVLAGGLTSALCDCNVTNCYSNQEITPYSSSIYGVECIGNCSNCYTSTYYEDNIPRIFGLSDTSVGQVVTNCYSYPNSWNNRVADSNLLNKHGRVWTQINCNANPYLLTSFNRDNYFRNTKRIKSGKHAKSEHGKFENTNYLIVDINGKNPFCYPKISIDNNTGVLYFDKIDYEKCHNDFNIRVLSYQIINGQYFNYQISNFHLHVSDCY